jgi:procollagen-lysine,2-oxoglutarate 5-dioxygenase
LVLVAIFVEKATPFMEEFWQKFAELSYPKNKIHLFIYNKVIKGYNE